MYTSFGLVSSSHHHIINSPFVFLQNWYALSKTLAEDAAVKFCKENDLNLVAINPGYVIGPILQPTLNLTSQGIMDMFETGNPVITHMINSSVVDFDSVNKVSKPIAHSNRYNICRKGSICRWNLQTC